MKNSVPFYKCIPSETSTGSVEGSRHGTYKIENHVDSVIYTSRLSSSGL